MSYPHLFLFLILKSAAEEDFGTSTERIEDGRLVTDGNNRMQSSDQSRAMYGRIKAHGMEVCPFLQLLTQVYISLS